MVSVTSVVSLVSMTPSARVSKVVSVTSVTPKTPSVVRMTLRLPGSLVERLYAVRGSQSLNGEIVARLEASLEKPAGVYVAAARERGDAGSSPACDAAPAGFSSVVVARDLERREVTPVPRGRKGRS